MARGLKRKLCGNTPPNRFLYKVNMEAVKKEKEKYATENSWVSTNDVLCEWIFTKVRNFSKFKNETLKPFSLSFAECHFIHLKICSFSTKKYLKHAFSVIFTSS